MKGEGARRAVPEPGPGAKVVSITGTRGAEATPEDPWGGRTWPEVERRSGRDRRARPTRFWDALLGRRRRHGGRRQGEARNTYVDVFQPRDVAMLVGIFLLNLFDALFTLRWLQMGGGERNPLMDILIQSSDFAFLFQKCVVVGLWLVVLMVHKNFRIARLGLLSLLALYLGVFVFHFLLHTSGASPIPAS